MNIGIDLDGVIFDSEIMFRTYADIFDIEICKSGLVNSDRLKVQDRYHWSSKQFLDFVEKYVFDVEKNAPINCGAKYVLGKLKEMGHNLFVISSRGSLSLKEIDITNNVLKSFDGFFKGVYLNAGDKYEICKDNAIDIMIDDNPDIVCDLLKNKIKCLFFKNNFDKPMCCCDCVTVNNWGEVYRYFVDNK